MEQLTQEWFAARKGKITGSRIGALLGCNQYKSRDDLMREMVRELLGAEREFKGNYATERGNKLEPVAIEKYMIQESVLVGPVGFIVRKEPEYDFLGASPDGIAYGSGGVWLIEIKCPMGTAENSLTNESYYHQMQLQMFCTGFDRCDLVVMDKDGELHIKRFDADKYWLKKYLPTISEFVSDLAAIIKDRSQHDKYLNSLVAIADSEFIAIAKSYADCAARIKLLESELAEYKAQLESKMTSDKIECEYLSMTKVKKEGSISYAKAIKELLPGADLSKYKGKETEYTLIKIKAE